MGIHFLNHSLDRSLLFESRVAAPTGASKLSLAAILLELGTSSNQYSLIGFRSEFF